MLATDSVNAFIFNASQPVVSKKGLKGLRANAPIYVTDMAVVSWQ